VEEEEEISATDSQQNRKLANQEREPEEAFLSIHSKIRTAIKKHLPWVNSQSPVTLSQ